MTYINKNSDGTHKYDMGLALSIRFDIASCDIDDAENAGIDIIGQIKAFLTDKYAHQFSVEDVNTGFITYDPKIRMTSIMEPCSRVVDHASKRVASPNVWLDGTFGCMRTMIRRWNSNLRYLTKSKDNKQFQYLDTGENNRMYTMPGVPEDVVRSVVTEFRSSLNENKYEIYVNENLRTQLMAHIEALYDDGVDLPKFETEVVSDGGGYGAMEIAEQLLNRARDAFVSTNPNQQPEPF